MNPPVSDPAAPLRQVGLTPGSTFGALFIGYALASILYGITCCQTLNYYRSQRSKNDGFAIKHMVASVWILDTAHQVLSTHFVYWYLIDNYGKSSSLFTVVWSVPTEMVINYIIGLIVQTFYVIRIWRIGQQTLITSLCAFLTIASFGIGMGYPAEFFRNPVTTFDELKYEHLLTGSLVITLATDIILAVVLAGYLYRRRTGFRRTDSMIMRLTMLTIATGGLTACFWLADLIAYVAAPTALWDYIFNPAVSKLYANSLLTMLNYREFVVNTGMSTGPIDFQSIHLSNRSLDTTPHRLSGDDVRSNIDVFVTKNVETVTDGPASLKPSNLV